MRHNPHATLQHMTCRKAVHVTIMPLINDATDNVGRRLPVEVRESDALVGIRESVDLIEVRESDGREQWEQRRRAGY